MACDKAATNELVWSCRSFPLFFSAAHPQGMPCFCTAPQRGSWEWAKHGTPHGIWCFQPLKLTRLASTHDAIGISFLNSPLCEDEKLCWVTEARRVTYHHKRTGQKDFIQWNTVWQHTVSQSRMDCLPPNMKHYQLYWIDTFEVTSNPNHPMRLWYFSFAWKHLLPFLLKYWPQLCPMPEQDTSSYPITPHQ